MVERIETEGRVLPGTSIAPLRRTAQDGREEEARRFQRELQRETEDGGQDAPSHHPRNMMTAAQDKKGFETQGATGAEASEEETAMEEDERLLGRAVDVVI